MLADSNGVTDAVEEVEIGVREVGLAEAASCPQAPTPSGRLRPPRRHWQQQEQRPVHQPLFPDFAENETGPLALRTDRFDRHLIHRSIASHAVQLGPNHSQPYPRLGLVRRAATWDDVIGGTPIANIRPTVRQPPAAAQGGWPINGAEFVYTMRPIPLVIIQSVPAHWRPAEVTMCRTPDGEFFARFFDELNELQLIAVPPHLIAQQGNPDDQ